MKFTIKKKLVAVSIATAVTLGTGIAAVAYWTASSNGSGGASTGTQTAYAVSGSSPSAALSPTQAPQALTASVVDAGPYDAAVPAHVTVALAVATDPNNAAVVAGGTCDASDYALSGTLNPASTTTLHHGDSVGYSGMTIAFKDKGSGTNQDACQGATVTLTYSV
jgi:hypothetical protein